MEKENTVYITPVSLKEANNFLSRYSWDYRPIPGCQFTIGCAVDGRLMGVIVVGRYRGDSLALQVDRIHAAGGRTAYCMLYGAAARAAKAMGYHRIMAFFPHRGTGFRPALRWLEMYWAGQQGKTSGERRISM